MKTRRCRRFSPSAAATAPPSGAAGDVGHTAGIALPRLHHVNIQAEHEMVDDDDGDDGDLYAGV